MQEVTTEMREKGINNMEQFDREEWRKNKTVGAETCANIVSVDKQAK